MKTTVLFDLEQMPAGVQWNDGAVTPSYQGIRINGGGPTQKNDGDTTITSAVECLFNEASYLINNRGYLPQPVYESNATAVQEAYHELLADNPFSPALHYLSDHYRDQFGELLWEPIPVQRPSLAAAIPASERWITSTGNEYKVMYLFAKRLVDVLGASLLLLLLAPVLLIIALLIHFDSPGPVLFMQERMGARMFTDGRSVTWKVHPFRMFKFRSMYHNVDQSLHKQYALKWMKGEDSASDGDDAHKLTDDPRITPLGRFLRSTSLDELPQLINVLLGDMSLVGPRPVPTYEVGEYKPADYERLATFPGITGLWQIEGRGRTTFKEQVMMDVNYIHQQCLLQDFKILLFTIPAVLSRTGAY